MQKQITNLKQWFIKNIDSITEDKQGFQRFCGKLILCNDPLNFLQKQLKQFGVLSNRIPNIIKQFKSQQFFKFIWGQQKIQIEYNNELDNFNQENQIEQLYQDYQSIPKNCSEKLLYQLLIYSLILKNPIMYNQKIKKSFGEISQDKFNEILQNMKSFLQKERKTNITIQKCFKQINQKKIYHQNLSKIKKQLCKIDLKKFFRLCKKNEFSIKQIQNKDIIIFLGNTGCGKTTTILYLLGNKMIRKKINNINWITTFQQIKDTKIKQLRTSPFNKSQTRYLLAIPQSRIGYNELLCDTPGFGDTAGTEVDLVNITGLISSVKKCRKLKLVVLISPQTFGMRGNDLRKLIRLLSKLIYNYEEVKNSVIFMFNRFQRDQLRSLNANLVDIYKNTDVNTNQNMKIIFQDIIQKTNNSKKIINLDVLDDQYIEILNQIQHLQFVQNPSQYFNFSVTQQIETQIRLQCKTIQKNIEYYFQISDAQNLNYLLGNLTKLSQQLQISCIQQILKQCNVDIINNIEHQYEFICSQFSQKCVKKTLTKVDIENYFNYFLKSTFHQKIQIDNLPNQQILIQTLKKSFLIIQKNIEDKYIEQIQLKNQLIFNAREIKNKFHQISSNYLSIFFQQHQKTLFNSISHHLQQITQNNIQTAIKQYSIYKKIIFHINVYDGTNFEFKFEQLKSILIKKMNSYANTIKISLENMKQKSIEQIKKYLMQFQIINIVIYKLIEVFDDNQINKIKSMILLVYNSIQNKIKEVILKIFTNINQVKQNKYLMKTTVKIIQQFNLLLLLNFQKNITHQKQLLYQKIIQFIDFRYQQLQLILDHIQQMDSFDEFKISLIKIKNITQQTQILNKINIQNISNNKIINKIISYFSLMFQNYQNHLNNNFKIRIIYNIQNLDILNKLIRIITRALPFNKEQLNFLQYRIHNNNQLQNQQVSKFYSKISAIRIKSQNIILQAISDFQTEIQNFSNYLQKYAQSINQNLFLTLMIENLDLNNVEKGIIFIDALMQNIKHYKNLNPWIYERAHKCKMIVSQKLISFMKYMIVQIQKLNKQIQEIVDFNKNCRIYFKILRKRYDQFNWIKLNTKQIKNQTFQDLQKLYKNQQQHLKQVHQQISKDIQQLQFQKSNIIKTRNLIQKCFCFQEFDKFLQQNYQFSSLKPILASINSNMLQKLIYQIQQKQLNNFLLQRTLIIKSDKQEPQLFKYLKQKFIELLESLTHEIKKFIKSYSCNQNKDVQLIQRIQNLQIVYNFICKIDQQIISVQFINCIQQLWTYITQQYNKKVKQIQQFYNSNQIQKGLERIGALSLHEKKILMQLQNKSNKICLNQKMFQKSKQLKQKFNKLIQQFILRVQKQFNLDVLKDSRYNRVFDKNKIDNIPIELIRLKQIIQQQIDNKIAILFQKYKIQKNQSIIEIFNAQIPMQIQKIPQNFYKNNFLDQFLDIKNKKLKKISQIQIEFIYKIKQYSPQYIFQFFITYPNLSVLKEVRDHVSNLIHSFYSENSNETNIIKLVQNYNKKLLKFNQVFNLDPCPQNLIHNQELKHCINIISLEFQKIQNHIENQIQKSIRNNSIVFQSMRRQNVLQQKYMEQEERKFTQVLIHLINIDNILQQQQIKKLSKIFHEKIFKILNKVIQYYKYTVEQIKISEIFSNEIQKNPFENQFSLATILSLTFKMIQQKIKDQALLNKVRQGNKTLEQLKCKFKKQYDQTLSYLKKIKFDQLKFNEQKIIEENLELINKKIKIIGKIQKIHDFFFNKQFQNKNMEFKLLILNYFKQLQSKYDKIQDNFMIKQINLKNFSQDIKIFECYKKIFKQNNLKNLTRIEIVKKITQKINSYEYIYVYQQKSKPLVVNFYASILDTLHINDIQQSTNQFQLCNQVSNILLKFKTIGFHIIQLKQLTDKKISQIIQKIKKNKPSKNYKQFKDQLINIINQKNLVVSNLLLLQQHQLNLRIPINQVKKYNADIQRYFKLLVMQEKIKIILYQKYRKLEASYMNFIKQINKKKDPLQLLKSKLFNIIRKSKQFQSVINIEILAIIFTIWTVIMAQKYNTLKYGYYQPTIPQKISCLILLGGINPNNLNNCIAQMISGQGRSLVIAIVACYLGLIGFIVHIGFLHSSLSVKQYENYKQLFISLKLQQKIKYGNITSIIKKYINTTVNSGLSKLINNENINEHKKVLLLNDIGSIVSSQIYGKLYFCQSLIANKSASQLLLYIWENKNATLNTITKTPMYKQLLNKYAYFSEILEEIMKQIIQDANDIQYSQINPCQIDNFNFRYKTLFTNLSRKNELNISNIQLNKLLTLLIKIGTFIYSQFIKSYDYIIGLTNNLLQHQKFLNEYYGITSFYKIPSFYQMIYKKYIIQTKYQIVQTQNLTDVLIKKFEIILAKNGKVLILYDNDLQLQRFKSLLNQRLLIQKYNIKIIDNYLQIGQYPFKQSNIYITKNNLAFNFSLARTQFRENEGLSIIQTYLCQSKLQQQNIKHITGRRGCKGSYDIIISEQQLKKINLNLKDIKQKNQNEIKNQINQKRDITNKIQENLNKLLIKQFSVLHKTFLTIFQGFTTNRYKKQVFKFIKYNNLYSINNKKCQKISICFTADSYINIKISAIKLFIYQIFKFSKSQLNKKCQIQIVIMNEQQKIFSTPFLNKFQNLIGFLDKLEFRSSKQSLNIDFIFNHIIQINLTNQIILIESNISLNKSNKQNLKLLQQKNIVLHTCSIFLNSSQDLEIIRNNNFNHLCLQQAQKLEINQIQFIKNITVSKIKK